MLRLSTRSTFLNEGPWILRRFNQVVCAKKKRPNNGFPIRKRKPRKRYSPSYIADDNDISFLYDDSIVEVNPLYVVNCTKHINKCVKRRNIREAQEVFDLMKKKSIDPDVVTYTALMKGYSRVGNAQRVFVLFKGLESEGIIPTQKTFNTIINACAINGDVRKALFFLDRMKHMYSLEPDEVTYGSMLKVCVEAKDLRTAKETFEEAISSGVKVNVIMLTTMIDVYAECCNKENIIQYFKECKELLKNLDANEMKESIWIFSSLLKLCARGSLTKEAMDILNKIRINRIYPDIVCYNTVIDGISKDKKLSIEEMLTLSSKIVDDMTKEGTCPNTRTYSVMINVALRANNLEKAIQLFEQMKKAGINANIFTYGTMIKAYEKLGDPSKPDEYLKRCLDLMDECDNKGIRMDGPCYTSLLSACANVANLDTALKLWKRMAKEGIERSVIQYSAMINVYGSIGDMEGAIDLFNEMKNKGLKPDAYLYGTMIKWYEKLGDPSKPDAYLKPCLVLVAECDQKRIKLNEPCYTSLLSACANASDLDTALKLWKRMAKEGVERNVLCFNAMIDVYGSVGDLKGATNLFNEMTAKELKPSEQTYGTMIKCYEKLGDFSKPDTYLKPCLDLLAECDQKGVKLDGLCYTSFLTACANVANLDVALMLWNRMTKEGVERDAICHNAMINIYGSVGDLKGATDLFNEMNSKGPKPDSYTYGAMIKAYEKLGDPSKPDEYLKRCLDLMDECDKKGIKLDGPCYTSLLSACANASNLDIALKLWSRMAKEGIERDVIRYSAMINVYGSVGDLDGAIDLFNEIKGKGLKPDSYTYGTMIKAYEKLGDPSKPDEYLKPCLDLLAECDQKRIKLDGPCYTSLLSACANASNLDIALNLWKRMTKEGIERNIIHNNAMIKVYLGVNQVDEAFSLLDDMIASEVRPDEVTYGTFMAHFVKTKNKAGAQKVSAKMKAVQVQPDKDIVKALKALGLESN
eukprot:g3207.t1